MSAFSTDFDDPLSSWGNHSGQPPIQQPLDQKVAKFLGELTRSQREAAEANGPVLTLAGAGSGKTKTLTTAVLRRLRDGVPPSRLLAVTFTNSAAEEMRERIKAMLGEESVPDWIGTFHGLSSRLLRQVPEIAGLRSNFDILDAEDAARVMKRVMIEVGLPVARDEDAFQPVKAMHKYIEELKDLLVLPDEADNAIESIIRRERAHGGKNPESFIRQVPHVYAQYQSALREINAADFADLLLWPTLGMQRRETIRARWAGLFEVIAGDEYQDVNGTQRLWLRLLARDHQQLFVVGDDDQSIYSFRRADIQYIRRFTKDYPHAKVVRLEENFRSTGHILAAANAVISKDANRLGKTLFTRKGMGAPIEIIRFRNAEEEAEGIAVEIEQRHKAGTPWNDFAILYRANHLSRPFEDALVRARIPYELQGDVGFYQRREIKDALALLRLCLMPDDHQSDEAFRRMINTPARGLGPKSIDAIEKYAAETGLCLLAAALSAPLKPAARQACTVFASAIQKCQSIRYKTLADQLRAAVEFTGYAEMWRKSREDGAKERLENLNELYAAVGKYESVQALFEYAALAGRERNIDTADRVRLMTLHGAKGSEFGTVFLPAWEEAIFPNPRAVASGDGAEERRLAYVGLTRAMRRCTISFAIWRRGENVPSPYIADIPQENVVQGWLSGTT